MSESGRETVELEDKDIHPFRPTESQAGDHTKVRGREH